MVGMSPPNTVHLVGGLWTEPEQTPAFLSPAECLPKSEAKAESREEQSRTVFKLRQLSFQAGCQQTLKLT